METREPLRIMVVTTVPETLAAFFQRQLRSLSNEGFEVHAVSSPGPILDGLRAGPFVKRHAIAMARQPNPVRDAKSLLNLFGLMRNVRPHIVHAHTPKAGLLGMAAAKAARVPVRLYTVHGLPLMTRTGKIRRILEMAESTSIRLSTRTYSVSRSVRGNLLDLKLCSEEKASVLGDGSCAGVDLNRFQPSESDTQRIAIRKRHGIPEGAVVVTYIGRLSHDKGVAVLANAWPQISGTVPNLHLLMAGEPDLTDPVSPEALEILKSDKRVHLIGNVPADEVPALYAASDFTVLPTFREGLSQVSLESGAMGLPIVASQVTGLDAIVHGVTGILVPPQDPARLADALRDLATNPDLRTRLGQAAREHISSRYSEQRVDQLWMTEYRSLVERSFPNLSKSTIQMEN